MSIKFTTVTDNFQKFLDIYNGEQNVTSRKICILTKPTGNRNININTM